MRCHGLVHVQHLQVIPARGFIDDHLVQLPGHFRADQKLQHVIEAIVQMPLKQRQAWGMDHLSRKPVPLFPYSLGKEMPPSVQSTACVALPISLAGVETCKQLLPLKPKVQAA